MASLGNVMLKTTEGVARFITNLMKEAFMRNILTKLIGSLVKPVLKSFAKRIDPGRYNGATLIGLELAPSLKVMAAQINKLSSEQ